MNKDQVKNVRNNALKDDGTGRTMASNLSLTLDNGIQFNGRNSFIVYNDDNNLVHDINISNDSIIQDTEAPFSIKSANYDNIEYMEALYPIRNFEKAIKEQFYDSGLITEDMYNAILDFAKNNGNSIPPRNPIYFKETVPAFRSTEVTQIKRKDGVSKSSFDVSNYGEKIELENWTREFINNACKSDPSIIAQSFKKVYVTVFDRNKIINLFTDMLDKASNEIKDFYNISFSLYNDKFANFIKSKKDTITNKNMSIAKDDIKYMINSIPNKKYQIISIHISTIKIAIDMQVIIDEKELIDIFEDLYKIMTFGVSNLFKVGLNNKFHKVSDNEYEMDLLYNFTSYSNIDFNKMKEKMNSSNSIFTLKINGNETKYDTTNKNNNDDFDTKVKEPLIKELSIGKNTEFYITVERSVVMLSYKFNVTYVLPGASIGDKMYNTLAEAINNSVDGDTIKINKNIVDIDPINVNGGKNITIDMNAFNIGFKAARGFIVDDAKVNFVGNGSITGKYVDSYNSLIEIIGSENDVPDYSVVNVGKDINVKSDGSFGGAIFGKKNAEGKRSNKAYGAKLNVDGKFDSTYGFSINGIVTETEGTNLPEINVSNTGSMTSTDGSAIYGAGYGKYNIDGELSGTEFGIEVRSGILNVNEGSTITATSEFTDSVPNGNGSTVTGAAIAVSQHSTNLPISVNITGGTITETAKTGYAVYEVDTVKDEEASNIAKNVSINISGGKFTGKIHSVNNKIVVTGGTFSEIDNAYIANGYKAVKTDAGFVIEKMDEQEIQNNAEAEIDSFVNDLNASGKLEIVEGENNTYSMVTNSKTLDETGLIDKFISTNPTKLEATTNESIATLTDVEDPAAVAKFKDEVNAMMPTNDGEVTELVFNMYF